MGYAIGAMALGLTLVIYPMMISLKFEALREAGRNVKGLGLGPAVQLRLGPSDRLPARHGRALLEHDGRLHRGLAKGNGGPTTTAPGGRTGSPERGSNPALAARLLVMGSRFPRRSSSVAIPRQVLRARAQTLCNPLIREGET